MPPLDNGRLFDLYKIAIDEYRFQVKLNWDRTAYHLTLNSGIIAIATGLLKVGSSVRVNLGVAFVFFVGMCASAIGIKTTLTGHKYYRRTIVKKTLVEDQLGLTTPLPDYSEGLSLAVGTTVGQNEHFQILHDTKAWLERSNRLGSITSWIVGILFLFLLANALGIAGSLWFYGHPALTSTTPPSTSP